MFWKWMLDMGDIFLDRVFFFLEKFMISFAELFYFIFFPPFCFRCYFLKLTSF